MLVSLVRVNGKAVLTYQLCLVNGERGLALEVDIVSCYS
jgi:hypothetical protein